MVIRCDGHPDCEDGYDEEDCDNFDPEEDEYERQEYERQRQRHRRYYDAREEDEIIDEDEDEDEFDDDYTDDDYPPEDEFDARLDLTDEEREEYAEYRREMMMRERQRRVKRSMHAMDGSVQPVYLCFTWFVRVILVQWRIQDFPEVPTPDFGAKTYYFARVWPKSA